MERPLLLFAAFLCLTACTQLIPNDGQSSSETSSEGAFAFFGEEDVSAYETQKIREGLADADTSDDAFLRMVQSVGGYSKFDGLMETANSKEVGRLHNKVGISFLDSVPTPVQFPDGNQIAPQAILDCNRTFSSAERGLSYRYNGHYMHIDGVGRPKYSNAI